MFNRVLLNHSLAITLMVPTMAFGQAFFQLESPTAAELNQAIEVSNRDPKGGIIRLLGTVSLDQPLTSIVGDVAIEGGTLTGKTLEMLVVERPGSLELSHVTFVNLNRAAIRAGAQSSPLIANRGHLHMRQVVFENIEGVTRGGLGIQVFAQGLILNEGQLTVLNSAFIDVRIVTNVGAPALIDNAGDASLRGVLVAYPRLSSNGVLLIRHRGGSLEVLNSTLAGNLGTPWVSALSLVRNSQANLGNTIIGGPGVSCIADDAARVSSLGGNLTIDESCGLSDDSDITASVAGLLPLRRSRRGVPIVELAATSPGLDTGVEAYCLEPDALLRPRQLDGNADGIANCDRGAFEITPRTLAAGGINGVFFDPEQNGSYLTIVDNPFNTLVIWNTFDTQGTAAWVFGTGQLVNGRSMIMDAFINRGGRLSSTGPGIAEAEPWGQFQINLDDCNSGSFAYFSDEPNFADGAFNLQRLAFVDQLGCQD